MVRHKRAADMDPEMLQRERDREKARYKNLTPEQRKERNRKKQERRKRRSQEARDKDSRYQKGWRDRNPEYQKRRYEVNKLEILEYRRLRRMSPGSDAVMTLTRLKHRAKRAGVICDLDLAQVRELLAQTHCAVSGIRFETNPDAKKFSDCGPFSSTIDRIVPQNGYTRKNVRMVCAAYNTMKLTWTDEDCLKLARALVERARSGSLPRPLPDYSGTHQCSVEGPAAADSRRPTVNENPEESVPELDLAG